jgi:hypothetical protein
MKTFTFFYGPNDEPQEPQAEMEPLPVFQQVPEDFIVDSVGPILYEPYTFTPKRRVYCKHRDPNNQETHTFMIDEYHWLWDFTRLQG